MSGTQRLVNLLELANQGPAMRAALAEEVAELLIDWPADCPTAMRAPCEALLARAAREVDEDIRARLRVRLYADPQLCARLLPRENQGRALIETARKGESPAPGLARALGLTQTQAGAILHDPGGQHLATACKVLGLGRAAFSALAVLSAPDAGYGRLDAWNTLPVGQAARRLRDWRAETAAAHAAE